MKTKYYICALAVMLLAACAEDKGNYDYSPVNEITIAGLNSSYTVEIEGELKIPITLGHTVGTDGHNLTYSWELEGTEIGTSKDLDFQLPATLGFGSKLCRVSVTDEATGMKFSRTFNIVVVSPFNWGYYMLCEDEAGNTSIAYMPVRTADNEGQELKPLRADNISGIPLGSKPVSLTGSFGHVGGLINDYIWTMYCTTLEGEYPVIQTNNYTFGATTLLSSASYADQGAGYVFSPQSVITDRRSNTFFITQGKITSYLGGLLYRPSKHTADYRWSHPLASSQGYLFLCVYDEISKKYYIVSPQQDVPAEGITGDSFAYDKVLPITGFPALEGHTVIGAAWLAMNVSPETSACITTNDDGINIFSFSCVDEDTPGTFIEKFTFALPEADESTRFTSTTNDWYFGVGNKIYTSPRLLPTLTLFADLPAELGIVTDIKLSAQNKVLVAALYNSANSAEFKGSLVYVNISTKEVTIHRNIMHRCVSLMSCNADSFGWTMGDGN